jgi:hypothetical protein
MTQNDINERLARVLTWTPERQAEAVDILSAMEAFDRNPIQLTDDQLAEVGRRRADHNPPTLSLAEFDQRLRRFAV